MATWSMSPKPTPAESRQARIACRGYPSWCFCRVNLSASAAARIRPSRTRHAEESWTTPVPIPRIVTAGYRSEPDRALQQEDLAAVMGLVLDQVLHDPAHAELVLFP